MVRLPQFILMDKSYKLFISFNAFVYFFIFLKKIYKIRRYSYIDDLLIN